MWLNRFTKVVAAASFLLVVAGAIVTSTGSGMALPDWPRTELLPYDGNWTNGIFYQYGHRLIAAAVALLTVLMAAAYARSEQRPWVRNLAFTAFAALALQALVGGLGVMNGLPWLVSTLHSGLAQIFFALIVALAVLTSPAWQQPADSRPDDARLGHLATLAAVLVFVQILLGALMRHIEATHAIPDYPLAFGRLIPDLSNVEIAVHFAHRIGALLVSGVLLAVVVRVVMRHRRQFDLLVPAMMLVLLVGIEIVLGAAAVITTNVPAVSVALVAAGALLLATSVVMALRANRAVLARADMRQRGGAR